MAPIEDSMSATGSSLAQGSRTKGRTNAGGNSSTPGKSGSGVHGRGTSGTKFAKSGGIKKHMERVEKPKELLEAIAARAAVLGKAEKSWEAVGASANVSHAFGSSAAIPDPVVSYAGPPSANSDHNFSDRIIYAAGAELVIHDVDDGRKLFATGRPKNVIGILHIAVDPTMQLISVCEDTCGADEAEGESTLKSQLSVYSLNDKERTCLATLVHPNTNQFTASVFTRGTGNQSKQLAAMCGSFLNPEIVIWNWDSKKTVKTVSLPHSMMKMRCAPSTQLMLTTSGESGMKAWYNQGETLSSVNLILPVKDQDSTIIDHVWMPSGNGLNKMCALSEVLEPGETKHTSFRRQLLYILEGRDHTDAAKMDKTKGGKSGAGGSTPIPLETRQIITLKLKSGGDDSRFSSLSPSQKGFVIFGNYGHVSFYERTDDKREPYIEVRHLLLGEGFPLVGGCMLPTEHSVVVITEKARLLTLPVEMNIEQGGGGESEKGKKSNDTSLSADDTLVGYGAADLTHGGVHAGPIICTGISRQRSIVATLCQEDNSVRVWNYETNKCEVVHYFGSDDPLALDVHNNGLFLIVSFKDRVRGYNIAMSSLIPHNEVIQKGCKEIKFSNGGDYFACASGINLVVFNTATFAQMVNFQGHMMAIKRIAWAPGDLVIFSASVDGCVYGWPTSRDGRLDISASNPRASAILSLEVDSSSLSFLPPLADVGDDGAPVTRQEEDRYLICSTMNGKMNMPAWAYTNSNWDHVSNPNHIIWGEEASAITCMKLSINRRHLYAGTKLGAIRIYAWPPINDNMVGLYSEIQAHSGSVVSIFESPRGDKLISSGEDGAVFVFTLNKAPWTKVSSTEHKAGGGVIDDAPASASVEDELEEDPFEYNNQVLLLSTDEMDDHIEEVASLHKNLHDLQASSQYKLSQLETTARENERRMAESFDTTLNDERDRYEQLRGEFDEKVKSLLTTIETKEADSIKVVSDLENRYEHKLSDQLDRYDKLAEEMELLRQKCEGLLLADRNDFTKQLNDTINNARLREKKMRTENKRITDDRASDESAFKEILDQQEHEYEDELRQLIGAAEGELIIERENIGKLRTLVQTKNTKLDQLKKKLIELSMASKARASLLNNEKHEKKKLIETIEHYKKNLVEREEVVAEKEKIIIELRSKTRTLENFRFVLDHRLQQLSAERGPIASHIEGLERHISTMYEELVEEFENKKVAEIQKEKVDQRGNLVMEDLKDTKKSLRKSERYVTSFKRELGNIVTAMVIGKELEESVRLLYRKYVKNEVIGETTVKSSEQAQNTAKALIHSKADDLGGVGSPGGPPTHGGGGGGKGKAFSLEVEETLIESAKEAERQKISKGKEAAQLKHRLEATKQEALVVTRKRLGENSNLLFEVNDLRKEIRKNERKIFERDETIKQLHHNMKEFKKRVAGKVDPTTYKAMGGSSLAGTELISRAETPNINDTFGPLMPEGVPPRGQDRPPLSNGNTNELGQQLEVDNEIDVSAILDGDGASAFAGMAMDLMAIDAEQVVSQPRVNVGKTSEIKQIVKSQSESVLKRARGVGIDSRALSGTQAKWIVHNAISINKSKSEAELVAEKQARGDDISAIEGQAWQPQPSNNLGTTQLKTLPQQGQSTSAINLKPAGMTKDRKRTTNLEGQKDRQISVLREEKDILLGQLDDSSRFCENQRVEISQLRKQLLRYNGLGFNAPAPGYGNNIIQNNDGGFQQVNSYTDDGIQMSDVYDGSQFQSGNEMGFDPDQDANGSLILNNEPLRVSRGLTNADRTGQPSSSDLADMKLGAIQDPRNPSYPNKGQGARGRANKLDGELVENSNNNKNTISLPSITQQPNGIDGSSLVEGD